MPLLVDEPIDKGVIISGIESPIAGHRKLETPQYSAQRD
jgi:hypothetical protein